MARMNLRIGLLLLFFMVGCFSIESAGAEDFFLSSESIEQLDKLANHPDIMSQKEMLLRFSKSTAYPLQAFAIAFLYKEEPAIYSDQLFHAFSINDYSARSQGDYRFVPKDDPMKTLKQIESTYPSLQEKRAQLLLAFWQYRDQNKWIRVKDHNLSLARFFRSAFLASIFKGSDLDAVSITNKMDIQTQRNQGIIR